MENKRNFIKRDRSNDKKIPAAKEQYRGVSWANSTDENTNNKDKKALRKDEPFVLMFRNFIFFDVKSYECRKGDLYIRNIVDGIILKRYFRMDGDDQLTVFKNREEFDAFMKNVDEKGYRLGPDKHIEFEKGRDWHSEYIARKAEREYYKGDGVSPDEIIATWTIGDDTLLNRRAIKSKVTDQFVLESIEPELVYKVYKVLQDNEQEDSDAGIHGLLTKSSDEFVLENYSARLDSVTGEIDLIISAWDGTSFTRDEAPDFFDKIVRVLEANPGSAQILTKNDFM